MEHLRARRSESGSGIISSLIGLIFIVVFLTSTARVAGLVILEERLNAIAADSARRLAMASALASSDSQAAVEARVRNMLPAYENDLSFSVTRIEGMLTFRIGLSHYSISIWPGLSAGPYHLSASATSHMEA